MNAVGRNKPAEATANVLNSVDVASTYPVPVIYQSGYLTIKGYDTCFKKYTLGFPNKEVERSVQTLIRYCRHE